MGQPTQRATNYTARSNIDTAQIFLYANGQLPNRAMIRQRSRRRQRRGEPHTEHGLGVLPPHPPTHNKQQRNAPQHRHTKCRAGQYRPETHRYKSQLLCLHLVFLGPYAWPRGSLQLVPRQGGAPARVLSLTTNSYRIPLFFFFAFCVYLSYLLLFSGADAWPRSTFQLVSRQGGAPARARAAERRPRTL